MSTDTRRTLLFLVKDGQILLAMKKRGFGKGKWNGVGGKIEPGESIEEALVRECQEEIAVTPKNWKLAAEIDFQEFHDGEPAHIYCHAYITNEWDGVPTESEEMAPAWFDIDKIPYSQMWDDDKYWLPRALAGETLKATFTLNQDNSVTEHKIETLTKN